MSLPLFKSKVKEYHMYSTVFSVLFMEAGGRGSPASMGNGTASRFFTNLDVLT